MTSGKEQADKRESVAQGANDGSSEGGFGVKRVSRGMREWLSYSET